MAGLDNTWIPFAVLYLLYMIPPTMMEVFCYYCRGGTVRDDYVKQDDSWAPCAQYQQDLHIYFKRFLDRPTSEAAKAFYSWLDWSSKPYDRALYVLRRNMARGNAEVSRWRRYIYGPFVFNWPTKQWLRGDDAAGWLMPAWGCGGEERGRQEFAAAKEKGYDKYYHYQIMRKVRREQAQRAAAKQELGQAK